MGETTGIGWTDHTANFWMGCQRVSPGCQICYAETLVTTRMRLPVWGPPSTTERRRTKSAWTDVPRWDRAAKREGVRRRLFVSSLADVFEDHPAVAPWRAEALAMLAACDGLDVQLLTKRPQNIRAMVPPAWLDEWPAHVWIGTTVEDQRRAEERIPHLLDVPARVRFLSCEPLLERVDLDPWLYVPTRCNACGSREAWYDTNPHDLPALKRDDGSDVTCSFGVPQTGEPGAVRCKDCNSLDVEELRPLSWVIVGGESGAGARPFGLAWARSIVSQCREAEVPVFVKQLGARPVAVHYSTASHAAASAVLGITDRAGADPSEWPSDLRVQEFPAEVAR